MTLQSPRIYTYKITFEEVPYYYYGMHQEKVFGEEYWGSPKTNKWCWELYTPKKQILETFDSRKKANEVEQRLIRPVFNTDKWCLNENCGGFISMDLYRKIGKKTAEIHRRNKTGPFDPEKKISRNGGLKSGKMNVESGHLQNISELKYICLETGFISSARGLSVYQTKRKIDVSKRRLLTSEEYREKTKRQFTVVYKNSEIYTGDNIDEFCKEHKLHKPLFVNLLNGVKISHEGFHLPGVELKFYVEFTIKTPEGEVVSGKNISKFCRDYSTKERKLTVSSVHKLIRGKIDSYQGFTLAKEN